MKQVRDLAETVMAEIRLAVTGREENFRLLLACLLAERHTLIEDVPGTGKTILVKSLARALGASFSRIQFTPDLLPSDITGVSIFERDRSEFIFHRGPVFANLVLADEINRASPKTQASLLECMEERQVSVDGTAYPLPTPFFMVLATQNPIEHEGTYPLPEAQLDRFAVRLRLGYPSYEQEVELVGRGLLPDPSLRVRQVTSLPEIEAALLACRGVFASDAVREYVVDLVRATREHPEIALGASPRAAMTLLALARTWAATEGREFVLPDDVKQVAVPSLAHRLLLTPEATWRSQTAGAIVEEVLERTRVPAASPQQRKA